MKKMTNMASRRLGVPGRPAVILMPGESAIVTSQQIEDFKRNRTAVRWLERGVLVLSDADADDIGPPRPAPKAKAKVIPKQRPRRDAREPVVLPDGITGKGVELHHSGGGWWQVYVNGFKVTDKNVRKEEAESISADYF